MRHTTAALLAAALLTTACGGQLVRIEPRGEVVLDQPATTSVVVDADGAPLAELHAEQDRELVPLDRVPLALRQAVLAIEDARFYSHRGVDARAIGRALVENAKEGRITQGGSTITQQLAKNAVVGDDRTIERKLEEASVALQLESQLTKDEILERYLNTVYFGNGSYGVQTASRTYFGVDVEALTLPQAALLAGLLRAPSSYDPFQHPDAAVRRRNLVLRRMATLGMVDAAVSQEARAAPLGVVPPPEEQGWRAPYFVAHVLRQLQHDPAFAVLGGDPVARADRLFRGGLRIETTLRPGWQEAAEQAVAATLPEPEDPRAAVVAIDPATGDVGALVGGRDYDDPTDPSARFNLAVDGRRQPGSTFKAVVLAAALARGRSLDDTIEAGSAVTIPVRGSQEPWEVTNYDTTDFGPALTLRQATAYSVNTVYARLMAELGPEDVAALASDLGVRRPLQPYLSLALGAQEVSPLEMASIQATLAAGGVYRPPTAVTRILGPDGAVLWERPEPEGERVLDEAVAWLTTQALAGVVDHGTGTRADLQRPMAGKTGTTSGSTDAWFAGYTPDLAAAVWIGFPQGRIPMEPPRTRIRIEGGNWPAELFARFGLRALAGVPASDFPVPEVSLVKVRVDVTRDCLPNPYTPPEVVAERGYLAGTEPTTICREPTGPPTVDVPDVRGMPAEVAIRLLNGAGFTVEQQEEASAVLPPGYVVRQSPEPGSAQTLADGYVATIWVSLVDRTPTAVPDVLNQPWEDAQAALGAAGFTVELVRLCPDGTVSCTGARQRPGRVWEQAPDAGAVLPRGSTVRVSVYPG